MRKGLAIVLTGALAALLLLPGGSLARPAVGARGTDLQGWAWHTETVDAVGNVGEHSSLVLDGNGRPHIGYYGSGDLKVAAYDGTDWTIQTLDSAGDVGLFTSIAHYGAGNFGISYYDATYGDLKYWQGSPVTVDSTGNVGQYTSLVFYQGFPRIAYYDAGNGDLKVAFGDGGWQLSTLDSAGDVGRYASLAVRPDNGFATIAYYDATNGDLKVAWQDTEGWNYQTVDSTGDVGLWTSLALDSNNQPHIVYTGNGGVPLKYVHRDGGGWHFTVLEASSGGHTSLRLDANDRPHLSYWKAGQLRYAYHDGADWRYETVDAAGEVGAYSSLVLDAQGRVGIAYRDDTNMDLKYAYSCCRARFTAAPQPQCRNQAVAFTNQTAGFGPFTYLWAFGDGASSALEHPSHGYAAGGVYTAWLTATAGCGADAFSATMVISSTPEAGFTLGPAPLCAGATALFTNTTVTSPTTTYQWAFGDGAFSTLENPTHTYAQPAVYEAVLIATNGCGLDVATAAVPAHGGPAPAASWSPAPPQVGHVVTFTAQATSTLPVSAYAWDLGDGSGAEGALVTHTYAATGAYTVVLTGTNACASGAVQETLVVVCDPLTATAFAWTPLTPTLGWPATFTATAGGTTPFTFAWSFGDGSTGTGAVVEHTYAATGTYSVVLTATNYCGQEVLSRTLEVVARPVAAFASNAPVCLGEPVAFTNTSSGAEPMAFRWTCGDGGASTAEHPTHTYALAGPHTVALTATNLYGEDRVSGTVEVWEAPVAQIAYEPDWPAPGEVVTFTAAPAGPPSSFLWDFGDGEVGAGPVVTHAYALTGTYEVLLTATNPVCGDAWDRETVAVAFCTPPAGLGMAHSSPLVAREMAAFTATLTAGSEPLTYTWDFGDGGPAVHGPPVVTHTYTLGGEYTVSVAAGNGCGAAGPLPFLVQVEQSTYQIYLPVVLRAFYPGDPYEPDDTVEQARPLPLDAPQSRDFAPEGDVDWAYLAVAAAGTYQVRTFDLGGGADTRLFLYDSGGALLASNDDCPGGQPPDHLASCLTVALAAGRYNLRVDQSPAAPGGPRWGPAVRYTLQASRP